MTRKEIKKRLFFLRKRKKLIRKAKFHLWKKSQILNNTTNRREYKIIYSQLIHCDDCWICSKRAGVWYNCRRQYNKEYDNPVRSWKYISKRKTQWKN